MTYNTSRAQVVAPPALVQYLKAGIVILLMAIGTYFSFQLLDWTMTKKFGQIEQIEESKITAELRDRQLECLAKNIYYEAGNEPFEGKVAVAQVTLNRANSGKFPSDVCKTIYQKNMFYEKTVCQFSWYCDRATTMKPINRAVYNESMIVAKKVLLEGFRLPSLEQALYFHGDYINPGWNRQQVAKVGRHIFYR
jgi:spore germination cell wall hydrolase CwlJ-like protein